MGLMVKVEDVSIHFNDPSRSFDHDSFALDDAIRNMIQKARKSLHLISYSLPNYNSDWYLHDLVEDCVARGVKLKVHANSKTEVQRLVARHRHRHVEGYSWVKVGDLDIFHIKAIIVDGIRLYLGSANLSQNAITNSAEWGMISHSPEICLSLEKYLQHLQNIGRFEVA
jgi:phosphatidylserine/phosphatidylglycerophosphate/cardiolipin synthase-like enzyme